MPLFGDKNTGDFVTQEQARETLAGYVSKADAQPFQAALEGLSERVDALETLAATLRRNGGVGTTGQPSRVGVTRDPVTGGTVRPQGSPVARTTASTTGVDYGAVAFGLAEIKREVQTQFRVTDGQMATKWNDVVQYFADVFAKSDTGFDADAFKRQAGV